MLIRFPLPGMVCLVCWLAVLIVGVASAAASARPVDGGDYDDLVDELLDLWECRDGEPAQRVLYFQWWNNGFGAEVHAISLALTVALMSNRTLITLKGEQHGWIYTERVGNDADAPHACRRRDESCYFSPLCSDRCLTQAWYADDLEAIDAGTMPLFSSAMPLAEGTSVTPATAARRGWVADFAGTLEWDGRRAVLFTPDTVPNPWDLRHAVPRRFQHHGLFWWRSMLVDWILRPNPAMARQVLGRETTARAFGWPRSAGDDEPWPPADGRCVAVHVRRGDKSRETRVALRQFDEYEEALRHVADPTVGGTVIVATDDASLADELVARRTQGAPGDKPQCAQGQCEAAGAAGPTPPPRFFAQRESAYAPAVGGQHQTGFHQSLLNAHRYNVTDTVHSIVRDLHVLSQCRAFIGTLSSNFGRLLLELMVARRFSDPSCSTWAPPRLVDFSPYTWPKPPQAAHSLAAAFRRDVEPCCPNLGDQDSLPAEQHNEKRAVLSFCSLDREWHVFP